MVVLVTISSILTLEAARADSNDLERSSPVDVITDLVNRRIEEILELYQPMEDKLDDDVIVDRLQAENDVITETFRDDNDIAGGLSDDAFRVKRMIPKKFYTELARLRAEQIRQTQQARRKARMLQR